MKIAIGCDHTFTDYKNEIINYLKNLNHIVVDCGNYSNEKTHYAIYGHAASVLVAQKKVDFAIVICGTGVGISNSANKTKNIRAVLTHNEIVAKKARELYDANVLCLGGRVTGLNTITGLIKIFLETKYNKNNNYKISKINNLIKNDNFSLDIFDEIINLWVSGFYTKGEKQNLVDKPKYISK